MFTGLIRDVGTISAIETFENSLRLNIRSQLSLDEFSKGASISCHGVCLTVCESVSLASGIEFVVDVGPETLAVTQFGQRVVGDKIHLEPAAKMGDVLGGHIVTGHIDGLVKVQDVEELADGYRKLTLEIPSNLAQYLIPKGSIAVGGVSLTLAHLKPHNEKPKAVFAEIMLIPHTLASTELGQLCAGNSIEIECDHFCKMVASVVSRMLPLRE